MDKDIRRMMTEITVRPDSVRKDYFLRQCRKMPGKPQPGSGILELLKLQLAYIRMPVWILSLMALVMAIWGLGNNREVIHMISALMPFVSGIAVFEAFRSRMYGMTEMESATFISLGGVLYARIICVGVIHMILLCLTAVILGQYGEYGVPMTGAILTVPYLASSACNLGYERTAYGRKNEFGCLLISAVISVSMIILQRNRVLFAQSHRWAWYPVTVILIIMECRELIKTFEWEEYTWSLR